MSYWQRQIRSATYSARGKIRNLWWDIGRDFRYARREFLDIYRIKSGLIKTFDVFYLFWLLQFLLTMLWHFLRLFIFSLLIRLILNLANNVLLIAASPLLLLWYLWIQRKRVKLAFMRFRNSSRRAKQTKRASELEEDIAMLKSKIKHQRGLNDEMAFKSQIIKARTEEITELNEELETELEFTKMALEERKIAFKEVEDALATEVMATNEEIKGTGIEVTARKLWRNVQKAESIRDLASNLQQIDVAKSLEVSLEGERVDLSLLLSAALFELGSMAKPPIGPGIVESRELSNISRELKSAEWWTLNCGPLRFKSLSLLLPEDVAETEKRSASQSHLYFFQDLITHLAEQSTIGGSSEVLRDMAEVIELLRNLNKLQVDLDTVALSPFVDESQRTSIGLTEPMIERALKRKNREENRSRTSSVEERFGTGDRDIVERLISLQLEKRQSKLDRNQILSYIARINEKLKHYNRS